MQANTLDDVIQTLDSIIDATRAAQDRVGYFAALYRRVTAAVKEGVAANAFENGPRMELLAITFANRYFAAFSAYRAGQALTDAWKVSFQATASASPMLLQHLLLGMNAHINLDLGIAAATVSIQGNLEDLKTDFYKINMVLASLSGTCIDEFGKIWPVIHWANSMLDKPEEIMADYQIDQARTYAWSIAQHFGSVPQQSWSGEITTQDKLVGDWGRSIYRPGFLLDIVAWLFNLTNRRTVADTIDILQEKTAAVAIQVQAGDNIKVT